MNKQGFKVGDRVVWVSTRHPDSRIIGVVTRLEDNVLYFLNETEFSPPSEEFDLYERFVPEEIYNSSLYKALREEN